MTMGKQFPLAIDGNVFGWGAGLDETLDILDVFYEYGGRVIYTADHYSGGRSEIIIGNWLSSRKVRDNVVIATKIGRHPDSPGLSRHAIHESVNASLSRLKAGRIDVLIFDRDDPTVPIDQSLRAVSELVAAGKVRRVAASEYSGKRLLEIDQLAKDELLPRFAASVCEYSLVDRRAEVELFPALKTLGRGAFARLPLANGFLTGAYTKSHDIPDGTIFVGAREHFTRSGMRVLRVLTAIAAEVGVAPASVALAWTRQRAHVIGPVVRVASREHWGPLFESAELVLTPEHIEKLDSVSRG